jgi:hypothetical protein
MTAVSALTGGLHERDLMRKAPSEERRGRLIPAGPIRFGAAGPKREAGFRD